MLSLMYYYSNLDQGRSEFFSTLAEQCEKNELVLIDICIDEDEDLRKRFQQLTPAIKIGPYVLKFPFTQLDLIVAINSAKDRTKNLAESKDKGFETRLKKATTLTSLDKFTLFFSKYYVIIISLLLSLFVAIPFLAPVLEKKGYDAPAQIIYRVYRVLCHQLAFRSFYLFGEQGYYPRELANIDGVLSYETVTGKPISDLEFARSFTGDQLLGFKVAICERDVAIYGALALFGFIFQLSRKRIKQLPWYLWFVFALIPIAIDGFSQIPGLSSGWPAWLPVRESTPFLRVLTGTLFGAGTGWYMFPLFEESMIETRAILNRKMLIINKISQSKVPVENEES